MPKINGHKAATPINTVEYELTAKLLKAFQLAWKNEYAEAGADPVLFSRLSVIALTQLSAIVAVDIGMPLEKFVAVCGAQHEHAYAQAPKFGE